MEQGLRRAVLDKLEGLDETVGYAHPDRLVPLARTEIRRLTDCWRRLLDSHQPDDDGRCPHCAGWLRRKRWPCAVWLAAHQHLIGEGVTQQGRRHLLRNPFRRKPAIAIPRQQDERPHQAAEPATGPAVEAGGAGAARTTGTATGVVATKAASDATTADATTGTSAAEVTTPMARVPRSEPVPAAPPAIRPQPTSGGIYRASVVERTGRRLPSPRVRAKVSAGSAG